MSQAKAYLEREGLRGINPDTPPAIIAEISHSPELRQYKEELIRGEDVQMNLARHRQLLLKQANDRIEHCFIDGIGARIASIDAHIFHRMSVMYGRDWFRDKACLSDTLRRHPELTVRAAPRRLALRVNGRRRESATNQMSAGHRAQPARVVGPGGDPATPERVEVRTQRSNSRSLNNAGALLILPDVRRAA